MPLTELRNYDPLNVVVTVDGDIMTGFTDGTFVTCEKTEDRFTTVVGADGTVSRAESANELGTITVTLKQTSPHNNKLANLANSKEVFSVDVLENGVFAAGGSQCWINKPAAQNRGPGIEDVQWTFSIADYVQI